MSYCRRLLQADILPQKLSRRSWIDIFFGSSGNACINTGTFSFASFSVSATPRSSPKLGRVTSTPSIRSEFLRKSAAHFFASS